MSSDTVICVENLSKQYRLGEVSTGTISHDLNRWWCRLRGKEDPYLKVTQTNVRDQSSNSPNSRSDYVWALRDINFEVKRGEVLGIIGRNGAGKSTLLKILSRVTAPTEGQVKVKGRIASLLEVGTGFHPELTGRENIYLNGAIMGMTKAEVTKKLDEIVEFSGCERYIDTPVKRYSSGMKVRLGFAVAAHLEPEILIVDEVLAVGDAEFQKKCIGKMQDVAGHGRTVLFVSHNMNSVMQLCSTGCLLQNGTIRAYGSIQDVVEIYAAKSRQESRVALDRRPDRSGNGTLRFVSFQVDGGLTGSACKSCEDVVFRVKLMAMVGAAVERASVSIRLMDMQDRIVATFFTGFFDRAFSIAPQGTSIDCHVPCLNLVPGRYSVHLYAATPDGRADVVDYASEIEIVRGEAVSYLRLPTPTAHGHYLLQQSWAEGHA